MPTGQSMPDTTSTSTEFEALMAAAPGALDAIPQAVYLCDSEGRLVRYNAEAVRLWGRAPTLQEGRERFCGSYRLFLLDGTALPHDECPMAQAVYDGTPVRNAEVVMERPDGERLTVLVNIRPLRDHENRIQGTINCLQDISDRKEMEAVLLRQKDELEDFFENSAVALHIVSKDGIILRANQAELDLLGYTSEEYIGRHIAEFHADDHVIQDILERLSCGTPLDRYPARLRSKDGGIKHVVITSNSRFHAGKFVNTRCFTMDVTELRKAEAAQRESDERLMATYQAAMVGIAETDERGGFVRVNDAMCRMLGRPRETLIGATMTDIAQELDPIEDAGLHARHDLRNDTVSSRAVRPDGTVACLDVSSSFVTDEQGNFRYGVKVLQDVTERQRMHEELKASEARLRELLEALPAAVYTTDADGRITFYNQAAIELAGRTPQLGSDQWCVSWRLYWPDGRPMRHDECPMAIALKEGKAVRGGEAVLERPDGTRVPFIPYPTPLRDADGRLVGAINMLVDITPRKEAEARQKVLIDELNHRVKNTLATVQSLARQTARHAQDLPGFAATFEARILALASAHDLLTRRHWSGAALHSLVGDIVAPYADDNGRVRLEGPALDIAPGAALSLTMAINELATNAAKYGALSRPVGSISVRWTIDGEPDGHLSIEWQEYDGPAVVAPSRRGFGTRLMERCVTRDLDGSFDLHYEPHGVRCSIDIPLARLARHE
ncbi:histidine kinase [Bordetella genomosp. 13]|uniref:histidine kinase n=2 Tax=Bordetella genomosp. 13 TaxID=463040 RepID=A0A1W6ZEP8_9BORD|nr:histidine kinase [Bordetella genomosp. 13]